MRTHLPALRDEHRDLLLFLGLALLCYADKILLGPFAVIDIYDSLEVHFAHFRSMARLWAEFGPFSWYPFHAGGAPSFVGQHPPWHPAVFLAGLLPLWLLSLVWNAGQMFLAGYGMSRFLPLLLGTSRQSTLVCSTLFALTWISGNVHFVLPYAFPAVFVWTVELFRSDSRRLKKLKAASLIALTSLFSFPVLTLPHFPILHLALVLFLGRQLPDFKRQVAGVFLVWTGYVLLFLPSIVSLFQYIPYTQREWSFSYPGFWPALLDSLRWLRGRLADQQFIALLLLGLPLLGNKRLRICYAFILVMLVVAGVFTSELKGLFAGTFLVKMDLFMFATALGIVGTMIASLVLDALVVCVKGIRWPWVLAVVALLPLLGAAHKVLVYLFILGAGLSVVALLRPRQRPDAFPRPQFSAVALLVCLSATGMLIRQQNMTSGMFAPYAQGFAGHQALADLAAEARGEPFRVACVDVHPVVAQARGLDTVGEKSPLFNKYYKELVREAVRPQFATPAQELAFTNLWRQLYLTRLQNDLDQRSFALAKAPQRSASDFNWDMLRLLNVRHVLATRPMLGMEGLAGPPVLSPGPEAEHPWLASLAPKGMYALPLWIYELKEQLPRVFLADPALLENRPEALKVLAQLDSRTLKRTAVVAREDWPQGLPEMSAHYDAAIPGEVRILSWSPDRIRLEGTAVRPCVLVAANNFDPHWRAELPDGTLLPTFRADHAFLGVGIDHPGAFRLDLSYANPLIWWLNLGSLLGLGLMYIGVFWKPRAGTASIETQGACTRYAPVRPELPWKTSLLAGVCTALVWAAAFGLFIIVLGRNKGPQVQSFPYALATIPVLGILVACWARGLLRRL